MEGRAYISVGVMLEKGIPTPIPLLVTYSACDLVTACSLLTWSSAHMNHSSLMMVALVPNTQITTILPPLFYLFPTIINWFQRRGDKLERRRDNRTTESDWYHWWWLKKIKLSIVMMAWRDVAAHSRRASGGKSYGIQSTMVTFNRPEGRRTILCSQTISSWLKWSLWWCLMVSHHCTVPTAASRLPAQAMWWWNGHMVLPAFALLLLSLCDSDGMNSARHVSQSGGMEKFYWSVKWWNQVVEEGNSSPWWGSGQWWACM